MRRLHDQSRSWMSVRLFGLIPGRCEAMGASRCRVPSSGANPSGPSRYDKPTKYDICRVHHPGRALVHKDHLRELTLDFSGAPPSRKVLNVMEYRKLSKGGMLCSQSMREAPLRR
jgi:hypothetical protein